MKKLIPKRLKEFDDWLLIHNPRIWSTQLHYALYYGILFSIVTMAVGFFLPFFIKISLDSIFYITVLILGLMVWFSSYWLKRCLSFSLERHYGHTSRWLSLMEVLLYNLCLAFVLLPAFVYLLAVRAHVHLFNDMDNEVVLGLLSVEFSQWLLMTYLTSINLGLVIFVSKHRKSDSGDYLLILLALVYVIVGVSIASQIDLLIDTFFEDGEFATILNSPFWLPAFVIFLLVWIIWMIVSRKVSYLPYSVALLIFVLLEIGFPSVNDIWKVMFASFASLFVLPYTKYVLIDNYARPRSDHVTDQ